MNASIVDPLHAAVVYYDSDYPSREYSKYPENFDDIVVQQGIADDVEKYVQLSRQQGMQVLELCCGTGRVAIPLAMEGCHVTAVDVSHALLGQFKKKIEAIPAFPTANLQLIKQDVTTLALPETQFDMVVCAFNSLLCIPDFHLQQQALAQAAKHLRPGGLLALDIWNPLVINIDGEEPYPYYTRRHTLNGNPYTRFAATGPMNIDQVQTVYGWYDETQPNGQVKRTPYSMAWRVIFRYEITLMLEKAGFKIKDIYGGNRNEVLTTSSLKMFIEASRC